MKNKQRRGGLLVVMILLILLLLVSGRANGLPNCSLAVMPGTATSVLGQTSFTTSVFASGPNQFANPTDVHTDPASGKIFVSENSNRRILRFTSATALMTGATAELQLFGVTTFTTCNAAELNFPEQVATFSNTLFVADSYHHRVLKIPTCNTAVVTVGAATAVFGRPSFTDCTVGGTLSDFNQPQGVVFDSNGTLWVADTYNKYVKKFVNALSLSSYPTPNGYLGNGTSATTQNTFYRPNYLGIDTANGHLFVADFYNRVLLFRNAQNKTNGGPADVVFGQPSFTDAAGACAANGLNSPIEPFYDAASDTLFVSNSGARVSVWSNALSAANGQAADTVIGQPSFASCGAGASPNASNFFVPSGISFNNNAGVGLLVVDYWWHRILRFRCSFVSNTQTRSISISNSNSKSSSNSKSTSLSNSKSKSPSNPQSNSKSISNSNPQTPSNSKSTSLSNSLSNSNSNTLSKSLTNSLTNSLMNSKSVSNSRSPSQSSTPTPSLSTGASVSNTRPATGSSSITNSASLSNSGAPSSSRTSSNSDTNSNSQSESNSNNPASSSTPSSSGSGSFSSSLSPSRSFSFFFFPQPTNQHCFLLTLTPKTKTEAETVSNPISGTGSFSTGASQSPSMTRGGASTSPSRSQSGQRTSSGMGSVSGQASLSVGQSPSNTPTSSPSALLVVVSNSETQTASPQASSQATGASQTKTPTSQPSSSDALSQQPGTAAASETESKTLSESKTEKQTQSETRSGSSSRRARTASSPAESNKKSSSSSRSRHASSSRTRTSSPSHSRAPACFNPNLASDKCEKEEVFEVKTGLKDEVKVFFSTTSPGFAVAKGSLKDLNVRTSFCPLRELDEEGKSVQEQPIESSGLRYSHELEETKQNITLRFSTRMPNGAFFQAIQTVFLEKGHLEFREEGVELDLPPNSVKYSYIVEKWPFKSRRNRLEICTVHTSSERVKCSKNDDNSQGGKVLVLNGYLEGSSEPSIHQNILKFATADGESVVVEVEEATIGKLTKVLVPSFERTLFYDPDFALLLGGGASNDPCAERDLMWTWICLGFLLGTLVFCGLFVLLEWRLGFVKHLVLGEEGFATHEFREDIKKNKTPASKSLNQNSLHLSTNT